MFLPPLTLLFTALLAHAAPVTRDSASATVSTPLGLIAGSACSGGQRFTIPFAQPPVEALRFANPQPIAKFAASGTYDGTFKPAGCYQYDDDPRGVQDPSEDCLYSHLYRPGSVSSGAKLPIMVWIHGGSGVAGSSTGSGLDACGFASRNNVIVVVLQYRLGLFGWLQTADTLDEDAGGAPGAAKVAGNMALRDVVMALQQVRQLAASFGGDAGSVTVMGQSSGAQTVRALLTLPAAQPLFQRAVLVSDTANYGMATQSDHNALGAGGLALLNCTDIACARSKTKSEILAASSQVYSDVPLANPSIAGGTPWRPMLGSYFPSSITSGGKTNKPVLISTVANEAGATAGALFYPSDAGSTILTLRQGDYPVPYPVALGFLFNAGRGDVLATMAPYATNGTKADETRSQFELGGSDGLWRCASRSNARSLAAAGTSVWLAEHDIGARYISNASNDYCTKSDSLVCHEDDIYLIFGTTPSPSDAQQAASTQMQRRLAAFARSGSPNASGYAAWPRVASASRLNMLRYALSGSSSVVASQHAAQCAPDGIWGNKVKYDWQLYEKK